VKKETRAQSIQRDENTQLSSLPSELGQVNEPKALNYLVITNTFGVGIELCGFRFALVSPILESQTLRGFENHLEKSNPHPHAIYKDEAFERDKQVKVKAFKTILKHKTLILENIHCSQEGCYYFKGLVFPKNSTLTPPRRC
jgi:hypothetical protein